MQTWIVLAMIILLLAVFGAVYLLKKENKYEPDYRIFFILGITWLPLGISTDNPAFLGLGALFMVLGLANRDKWKEQPKWSEMDPARRKFKIAVIIGLTVLLVGLVLFFLITK